MKTLKLIAVIISGITILQNANAQDRLILQNGKELPVVIEKETAHEVYFMNTGGDSSHFMILKSDLKQVNYANGDSIVFAAHIATPADPAAAETAGGETTFRNGTYNCWIYGVAAFNNKMRRGLIHSVADSGIVFAGFRIRKYIHVKEPGIKLPERFQY